MKKKILITLVVILALIALAAAIYIGMVYKQQKEEEARQAEIAAFYANPNVTMVVTPENISELELYTNLQNVDLTGSTCYEEIMAFIQAHPGVNVAYTVELGGTTAEHDAATLELPAGSFDYDTLTARLPYLPQVTSISLPATDLTYSQINDLRAAYPEIDVRYTVRFLEQELEEGVTSLDLSAMDPARIEELAAVRDMLPVLSALELMDEAGASTFGMTDVKTLMDTCPGLTINYTFDFYGQTLSTATETVEFQRADIGNEGEPLIRQALDIMPNCTYFKLDDCGVDSTVMASIRDDYPNTKVVWRIFFGKFNCLTDAEMLRLTNGLKNEHVGELIYCTDVKYMDIGHNEDLSDISFIPYMPKLELLILSGSIVDDLSVFENHPSIEFLELCFCSYVKDVTPLASCPNLKYLNISYTKVRDISPLFDVPLERFCCMQTKTPQDQQAKFDELHPDAVTRYKGTQCYGYAWRYVDDGITFWDYYANMRVIFMYDDAGYVSGKEYKR